MDLLWPIALLGLLVLPLLIAVRIWSSRRRRSAVRFSSLSLVHAAAPRASRIKRHLPFALFLIGLGSLVFAVARPVAIVSVPAGRTTVVLAMDVSRSMCSADIPPNRLLAAEAAAASFIERQNSTTQIGIVAFAGFGEIVQTPTTDQEVLLDVIESLATGRRTAIGSAILQSINAIAEIDPSVGRVADTDDPTATDPTATEPPAVPQGAYAPAIIVLLTDGASNAGPDPIEAAELAQTRGIRVYTIGFGTADPGDFQPGCGQQFIGNEPGDPGNGGGFGNGGRFGGGGGGGGGFGGTGGGFRRAIDEDTLNAIADTTGGTYYPAESADQLTKVFDSLPTDLITKHEVTEISVLFVGAGVLFVALAILLGQAWRPLP